MGVKAMGAEALHSVCDPGSFGFETTDDLEILEEAIGQGRALEALRFGIGMAHRGYNVFAMGPTGMGKHYVVRQFLEGEAARRPAPSDWCYVHNFKERQRPAALQMPAGRAGRLRAEVDALIGEVKVALSSAFEGDDYRTRKKVFAELLGARQRQAVEAIEEEANQAGIAILRSPGGLALVPLDEGEVMSQESFEALEAEVKAEIEAQMEHFREVLAEALQQEPVWEREQREKMRQLNREVAEGAIRHLVDEVVERNGDLPQVVAHLEAVLADAVEHAARLVEEPEEEGEREAPRAVIEEQTLIRRYRVNVLVDHEASRGAPVVYEDLPTVYNLIGRVEHQAQMGALVTDFSLVRAGALHRANGGFLILDALALLEQPHAWELLKRALWSGEVRTEPIEHLLDHATTISLEPAPIPLNVKVVLVGEHRVYMALMSQDEDFAQLFKVAADFEIEMPRTAPNVALFARLLATLGRKGAMRPMDRGAVAALVDQASRLTEDQEKLSLHIQDISDLLREANHEAEGQGLALIGRAQVTEARRKSRRRNGRVREQMGESARRGITLIATEGRAVGQINGLSVLSFARSSFGQPSRITAVARLGRGEVVDIEREVELGGPLHSKGVFILTGFFGARYAADMPLALSASLAMEQSYMGVDGDSATCAEACALLSALSGLPIDQGLAITGSMNQLGQVQAIGGVNPKIEGFFDLCASRGLTGAQGVVIPASNTPHLMLDAEVVEAVAQGRFFIYPVRTVDEAIEVLTGVPAGARDDQGLWPEGSVNRRVQDRLGDMARKAREWRMQ